MPIFPPFNTMFILYGRLDSVEWNGGSMVTKPNTIKVGSSYIGVFREFAGVDLSGLYTHRCITESRMAKRSRVKRHSDSILKLTRNCLV